ncbi:hypothetical protein K431DRAFT_53375 [Polychaeton citri CBS 116435]|uniref:Uncharacterized protein n=1 Tax=Polychaeton citri CBS 116435 TaxID=1314669 RepID=A0A9P4QHT0_9PEZI|nr:hypothetical protein K431DRAFT_53375 [Polychaeton citri CBS 116435]
MAHSRLIPNGLKPARKIFLSDSHPRWQSGRLVLLVTFGSWTMPLCSNCFVYGFLHHDVDFKLAWDCDTHTSPDSFPYSSALALPPLPFHPFSSSTFTLSPFLLFRPLSSSTTLLLLSLLPFSLFFLLLSLQTCNAAQSSLIPYGTDCLQDICKMVRASH